MDEGLYCCVYLRTRWSRTMKKERINTASSKQSSKNNRIITWYFSAFAVFFGIYAVVGHVVLTACHSWCLIQHLSFALLLPLLMTGLFPLVHGPYTISEAWSFSLLNFLSFNFTLAEGILYGLLVAFVLYSIPGGIRTILRRQTQKIDRYFFLRLLAVISGLFIVLNMALAILFSYLG